MQLVLYRVAWSGQRLWTSPIVADGFSGAAFPGLFGQGDLFWRHRLAVDIAETQVVLTLEYARSDLGAESAIDAGCVVIVGAWDVIRYFVFGVGHLNVPCWLIPETSHVFPFDRNSLVLWFDEQSA
jgi:hypothetical protein